MMIAQLLQVGLCALLSGGLVSPSMQDLIFCKKISNGPLKSVAVSSFNPWALTSHYNTMRKVIFEKNKKKKIDISIRW